MLLTLSLSQLFLLTVTLLLHLLHALLHLLLALSPSLLILLRVTLLLHLLLAL